MFSYGSIWHLTPDTQHTLVPGVFFVYQNNKTSLNWFWPISQESRKPFQSTANNKTWLYDLLVQYSKYKVLKMLYSRLNHIHMWHHRAVSLMFTVPYSDDKYQFLRVYLIRQNIVFCSVKVVSLNPEGYVWNGMASRSHRSTVSL